VADRYMPVQNLDVLTMLGFVILIGVVVNNAILLVHQALNFMRGTSDEGPGGALSPREAIAESVRTRVRPIMMTTLTSLLGMLPLVLAPGSGSELYRGLGAVVLGGLLVSTIFTLVVVPLLFSLVCDIQTRLGFDPRGGEDITAVRSEPAAPAPAAPAASSVPTSAGTVVMVAALALGGALTAGCGGTTDARPSWPEPGVEDRLREIQVAEASVPTTAAIPQKPIPARLPEAVGARLPELEALGGPSSWASAVPELPPDLLGRVQEVKLVPLRNLVIEALEQNLDVRLAKTQAAAAREGIVIADAAFDMLFVMDALGGERDEPRRVSVLNGTRLGTDSQSSSEQRVAAGLQRKIDTGASVRLESFLERVRNLTDGIDYDPDPAYANGVRLSAIQPLLRGAGAPVNLADTESARLAHERGLRRIEAEMLVVAETVEAAYWDLHEAWERLRIQEKLTAQGAEVERVLRERQVFDTQPAQWADALAVLAERRAELVRAIRLVKALSDRLKAVVNDPKLIVASEALLQPLDRPGEEAFAASLRDSLVRALDSRPEVREAVLFIEDARLREMVARNQALPRLDARVDVAMSGLDDTSSHAVGSMATDGFVTAFAGVAFEIPIGNRAAEAEARRVRQQGRAALLRYEDVLRSVVNDVKSSLRDLGAAHDLVAAARESRIAQAENLRALLEEKRERRQLSPEFLALEFQRQERLADAQREEVRAIASWRRSLASYRRSVGQGPGGGRVTATEE
jgi:outer membrane protein TolC